LRIRVLLSGRLAKRRRANDRLCIPVLLSSRLAKRRRANHRLCIPVPLSSRSVKQWRASSRLCIPVLLQQSVGEAVARQQSIVHPGAAHPKVDDAEPPQPLIAIAIPPRSRLSQTNTSTSSEPR
jgi:hypothetical protein